MRILGIESSCDETAAAVLQGNVILSSLVATQHDVHERFGGVVPELASRRHIENIVPLIQGALAEASLSLEDIDGIAVTAAPGLVGSLLVGLSVAKAIAFTHNIPFIGVNHLEGHLSAPFLKYPSIPLPFVGLVVSGGHTSLYLVRAMHEIQLLGATRDDAAGEAFDKVAKLLGLGYPGGPAVERAARQGDERAFRFSPPKFSDGSTLDFSFSGIKTACLLLHRQAQAENNMTESFTANLAASFQRAVVQMLVDRLLNAARRFQAHAVVISGGVAANGLLRDTLTNRAAEEKLPCFIPPISLCTDNAAMIAYVGGHRLARGERSDYTLNAQANQEIGT